MSDTTKQDLNSNNEQKSSISQDQDTSSPVEESTEQCTSTSSKKESDASLQQENNASPQQKSDRDHSELTISHEVPPSSEAITQVSAFSPTDDEEEEEEEEEEDSDDEEEDDHGMSLGDHLRELRKRLLYAIIWMVIGFIPCYAFGTDLFLLLKQPLIEVLPEGSDIIFTGLPDGFFTEMKIGLVAGIFLASPMIFYQLWSFIAPGLYKEEKAFILPIAFFSGFFFITGGAFCYFITFPVAFKFFLTYNSAHMKAMLSATEYLSFSLHLIFAFGLVFELPLVVFFLSRIGLVTPKWLRKMRRYAILAIVIVAAILAPPDVLSQLLMCVPMFVLYEISIIVAVLFGKEKPKEEEEEEDSDDDEEEDEKDNNSDATT